MADHAQVQPAANDAVHPIRVPVHVGDLSLSIPEFYKEPIPATTKAIYDTFGIRYVHVKTAGAAPTDYYVYSNVLPQVVQRYNLYV